MFKDKKLVCFDLDGTLIDSVGIWNQVDAALIQQLAKIDVDHHSILQQRDTQLNKFRQSADPYLEYCTYLNELYAFNLTKEQVKLRRYAVTPLRRYAVTPLCHFTAFPRLCRGVKTASRKFDSGVETTWYSTGVNHHDEFI